jgi:hypothetical protein
MKQKKRINKVFKLQKLSFKIVKYGNQGLEIFAGVFNLALTIVNEMNPWPILFQKCPIFSYWANLE